VTGLAISPAVPTPRRAHFRGHISPQKTGGNQVSVKWRSEREIMTRYEVTVEIEGEQKPALAAE
jgi:hypothetical protein